MHIALDITVSKHSFSQIIIGWHRNLQMKEASVEQVFDS